MTHIHATHCVPRMHGIVWLSGHSRQYFRWYLPLLALSREETAMQGGHTTARDTQHAMVTKAWHICPHAQERRLSLEQETCKQATFLLPSSARVSPEARQGKRRTHENSSGVTILIPEAEERMDESELELEQPELGRPADRHFADPEEAPQAPTSPGPPGRPSVLLTIRRNRTTKSKLSALIERVHSWARRVAWCSALRKALRRCARIWRRRRCCWSSGSRRRRSRSLSSTNSDCG